MRRHRMLLAAVAAAFASVALTGCSDIDSFMHETFPEQFGPLRGEDGAVVAATEVSAKYLELDDCFDFADPDDRARVTIMPCAEPHTYRVIGTGQLSLAEQREQGLQLAISSKCKEPFDAWAATMPAEARKDQEFLVREEKVDERTLTLYTCIAALQKLS